MPIKHHINLTLTPHAADDGYDLSQDRRDDRQVLAAGNQINIADRHHYVFHFTLNGDDLTFDDTNGEENIFLVRSGTRCPTRSDTSELVSFPKRRFDYNQTTKTLTVKNLNRSRQDYNYCICIKEGDRPRDFDPVIINNGGGSGDNLIEILSRLSIGLGILIGAGAVLLAHFTGLLNRVFG